MLLSASLLVALAGAPLADAWPYAVKRAPDGALEYAFDLTPLRVSKPSPDAVEAHGEAKVKAFLKDLPRSATVRVHADGLELTAGREVEWGALASSFSQVGDGPWTSDNPLARRPAARLRAPLDPEEPKVLVPAELLALQVRQLEDAALAAIELDTEILRRQLYGQAAERAVKRFETSDGDVREGALALAGRLYAASACLDEAKLAALGLPHEVANAARADVQRLTQDVDARVAPAPWSRTAELSCVWIRTRALAQPFEQSRAGTAAVLTWLLLLEQEPKLAALAQRVALRRDRFEGLPASEPLLTWKQAAGGDLAGALERTSEFLDALPIPERRPPGLLALATTPFGGFLGQLEGAELSQGMEELAAAVQDGRITPATGPDAAWPVVREAALVALAADGKGLTVDGPWRTRLKGAFAAVQGGHVAARGGGLEATPEAEDRTALSIRLNVPPTLELEPLPELYGRLAQSLGVLAKLLAAERLTQLKGLELDGKRGPPVAAEAKKLIRRFEGLAKLAAPGGVGLTGPDVADARRFLAQWRKESSRDVRQASAAARSTGGERQHAAVVGVSRRELVLEFTGKPSVTVVGAPAGFVAQVGEQRYLVPVLVTVGGPVPANRRPLNLQSLKAALEAVQHDASKAEGAVIEAVSH